MRPEIAAFRELDTLVRNLTDQLAGYRRRALSAESRVRELELQLSAVEQRLSDAQEETAAAAESREHALAAAREATAVARSARDALARLEKSVSASAASSTDVFPEVAGPSAASRAASSAASSAGDGPLGEENERLRAKLSDARERTARLADRVRFLRQQMGQGAER